MKAIILGATGLVGSRLLELLLADARFEGVLIFTRRATGKTHVKLTEKVIDFNNPGTWQNDVKGDVLFSAFGTTLKKAGSKDAQYKIDYTYQHEFAKAAAKNGVATYILVSAAFSNPKSAVFYSRMKGELEQAIRALPFSCIHILRPGILEGYRKEKRPGESAGVKMAKLLSSLPWFKGMRPIRDVLLAKAMINLALNPSPSIHVHPPLQLFKLAAH